MENNRNASSRKFRPRWGKPVIVGVKKQEASSSAHSSASALKEAAKKKFRPRWGQPVFVKAPQSEQAVSDALVHQSSPHEDFSAHQKVKQTTMISAAEDRKIIESQRTFPNDATSPNFQYENVQPRATAMGSLRNIRTWAVAAVVCLCVAAGYWYYQAQKSDETVPEVATSSNAVELNHVQETTMAPEVAIRDLLMTWLNSWQAADIKTYSSFYAPDFKAKGMDLKAWIDHKTTVFKKSKNINITIENVRIAVDGNSATVEFTQHYSSSITKSSDQKSLKLKKIGNEWKIYSEMS